ncbi:hypothetical protein ACFPYM_01845, partial [Methylobacterium hispanicum]
MFPKGSQQARTITNRGQGTDATVLRWKNANGGIRYDFSYFGHSAHLADLTLSTEYDNIAGSGSAYRLNSTSEFYPAGHRRVPYDTVRNVVTRGGLGAFNQQYWNKGIDLRGTSNCDIVNIICAGGSTSGENSPP